MKTAGVYDFLVQPLYIHVQLFFCKQIDTLSCERPFNVKEMIAK